MERGPLKGAGVARRRAIGAAVISALVLLPLAGAALAGQPLKRYLAFPPRTLVVGTLPFSWLVFALGAVVGIAMLGWLVWMLVRAPGGRPSAPARRFPWWGWAGLALCASTWIIAWTRMGWADPLQPYTFTPLWLGYVLVVNALRFRLDGRCMLVNRPRFLATLFVASAAFWWYFEYLNRFVRNWHYAGIGDPGALSYVVRATLPFATVLPAVIGTFELLEATRLGPRAEGLAGRRLPGSARTLAGVAMAVGALGLLGIAVWPRVLFPLVWVAPALIMGSVLVLSSRAPDVITPDLSRRILLLPVAALVCGFFWEMWNAYSMAKWHYQIPWVGRFRIFEMPVLGYLGYLTFGWECGLIASAVGSRGATAP